MDFERAIIVAGMVSAVVGIWAVPGAFAWGLYLGAKAKHRRRRRAARQGDAGKAALMGYRIWR